MKRPQTLRRFRAPSSRTGKLTLAAATGAAISAAWTLGGTANAFAGIHLLLLFAVLTVCGLLALAVRRGEEERKRREAGRRWQRAAGQCLRFLAQDLDRPMRRISGKNRELQAALKAGARQPAEPLRELMQEIERQAPNYKLALRNIRSLVNLENGETRPRTTAVDVPATLEKTAARYETAAREQNKLLSRRTRLQGQPMARTSPEALESIAANLLGNAVKHARKHIEMSVERRGAQIIVTVEDDGNGVEKERVNRIFNPRWTPQAGRREGKASGGIGLHIARSLARQNGGDVTLLDPGGPEENRRTIFRMNLPDRQHRQRQTARMTR